MSKNANAKTEKLIPTIQVIQKAIARGVSFGYGDPKNRIRYLVKNGLLPNQTRKRDGKNVMALMPKYAIDLLVNIQTLQDEKKLSIAEIKDYVNKNGGLDSIRFLNQVKVSNNTKGKDKDHNNINTNTKDRNTKNEKVSKIPSKKPLKNDKSSDKSNLNFVDPTDVKIKIYHSNGASTSVKSHAIELDSKNQTDNDTTLTINSNEKLSKDETNVSKSTELNETPISSTSTEPYKTKPTPSKSDEYINSTTFTESTAQTSTTDTNSKDNYENNYGDKDGDKRDKDDNKRGKDSNKTDKDDDKKVQSPQISPLQVAKSYYDVNFNLDENEEKDNFVNKETADIVTSTHKTLKIFGALLIAIVLIFVLFFTTLPISKNSTNVAIDTNQGEVLGVASNLVEDNPVKRLAKIVKEKYFKNLFNKIDQTELGSLSKFNPINEKLSQYNDQQENNENNQNTHDGENILGEEDENSDPRFFVNIPSVLSELQVRRDVVFDQNISVGGISNFLGNLEADGQNLNLGLGEITASNVVYSLTPGAGIEIVGGQTPTISNTGVLSFGGETGDVELTQGSGIGVSGTTITNLGVLSLGGQTGDVQLTQGSGIGVSGTTITNLGVLSLGGQTGDLVLEAGAGISVSGLNVTNIDPGSAQSIFKTINVDGSPVVATSNVDAINFLSGPGVNIALDPVTKTLTFDSLPAENELDIEAYIFDDDNTGTMTSGNLDLDQMGFVGTLPLTAGGLDMDLSSATDGQLLIGNGAGFSLSTLTQGAGITIVNGAGEITITNLLGNTIDTTEIVNQTILPEDINALAAPLNNQILTYNSASQRFQWQDVGGIVPGDISTVGDITEGAAFSQTSAYDGNWLYFEGVSGSLEFEIALTAEPATSDQILTLPNKTGTIAVLDDIHDPVSLVTSGYTFLSLVDQQLQLGQVDLSNDVINLLPVTNGGTGANTPGGARANLGLEIGVNVQAYDANTSLLGQTIEGSEITDGTITYAELDVIAAPLDTQVLSFDNTSGQFNWLDQIDINAGFLNSLTSDDFLRSNASDQFTSGTLTFNTGTQLTLSAGTVFNLSGTFNLGGTQVLTTATELNILSGTTILASELNTLSGGITLGTETNGDYVQTITAGDGLAGDGIGESSTPTLSVNAGNGIQIVADAVAVRPATTGVNTLTSSYSGLEVDADGVSILTGCQTDEILAWNGTAWACTEGTNLGLVSGTGQATRVAFWTGADSIGSSANLFWDDTSNYLGVGVPVPTTALDISGGINATGNVYFSGLATGTSNEVLILDSNDQVVTANIDSRVWGTTLLDDNDIGVTVQAYNSETSLLGQTIESLEITNNTILPIDLNVVADPADDGYVLVYNLASTNFEWVDPETLGRKDWFRDNGIIYPTESTDDLAIGGTNSASPFFVNDSGTISFSSDTNLYRSAVNTLRTDDDFVVNGATGLSIVNGDLSIGGVGLDDSGVNSGATLVGVDPTALTYSASTDVQSVLEDLDVAIGNTGDIYKVGDVDSGDAFTSDGTQGTALWFYDADGRGQLTIDDLTAPRSYTLPDATGYIPIGTGTNQYVAFWTGAGTLGSEQYLSNTRGGTGINTASSTGIPSINAGVWSVVSQVSPLRGGTGDDTSTTTGVPYIDAGNWLYETELSVSRGGTGVNSLTTNGVLYGNGSSAIQATSQGTDGYLLYSNLGTPDWLAQSSVNAGQLDSLDSTQFLRSDTSDSFTSGTLTLDPGTILAIGGSWSIGGTTVNSTATELNILSGALLTTSELNVLSGMTSSTAELNILTGATLSTAELNLLTGLTGTVWTSDNDGPGSGLNADLLDGQEGTYYTDASNIDAGTLGTDYFSAYSDLSAEGILNNDAGTDLLTRDQQDSRFVNITGDTMTGYLTLNANPTLDLQAATKLYVDQQDALYNEISEMTDTNINALAGGQILIYDGVDSWDNLSISGDAGLASDGTFTLNDNVIDDAELANSISYSGTLNLTGTWQIGSTTVLPSASELNILDGAIISTTELNLLDNRTGTLVDSNNVGTYAVTSVTAGDGLIGGGAVGDLTLNANTGNGLTISSDAITVQLANTGATTTTSSYSGLEVDGDGLSLLTGCNPDEVLYWDGNQWTCASLGSLGITEVGDVSGGAAFTATGNQGTSLWFYDPDGRGQLTRADLTTDRVYTLPDVTGTFAFGTGTTGYSAYWTGPNTLSSEQYVSVSRGGTGVGSFTSGGILYGNNTGAIQATAQPTDGQILIGSTGNNPVLGNISGTANQVSVTDGAGTISLSLPQDIANISSPTFATLNTGQGDNELYAMNQNVRTTDNVQYSDVLFTPKTSATGSRGRVYYDTDDDNLYVYDGSQWVDLTQQDTDTVLNEAEVEGFIYDNDNSLDSIGGTWAVSFGGQSGQFNLDGTGGFEIQDNGVAYATFDADGVFTLDSLRLDGNTLGLTTDSDLISLADGALTINGSLGATGSITGATDETINGVDINSGTISDVVNLTINTGGDLTIGTKGLNDAGTNNTNSGATLIGVYAENLDNSTSNILQIVLEDLDSALTAATHNPVSLNDNGYGYLTLDAGTQTLSLGQVNLSSEVTGILPAANGGTGLDTSVSTGVPTVSSGVWSVQSQLSPNYGGTGDNTSGTTGVPYINAGNWLYESQLSVARGGTGASTLTSNGVLYGNATGAIQATSQGTDTYVLYSNAGVPSWTPQSTLDAGQLDSLDSTDFLRSNANDSYTAGTLTFNTGTTVTLDAGSQLNIDGIWFLGGTQILPDAGEINILDGSIISTAELNTLSGGITLGSETNGDYVASLTAGNGLSGNATGEGSTPTLSVNTGNGITIDTDNVTISLATTGGTTGTSSYSGLEVDSDGLSLLSGCANDEVLAWNGTAWACTDLSALGITAVGDVTGGEAFTETGNQGTSLWFYDAEGRGQLTIADLTQPRTYTLPDTSGTLIIGTGSNGSIPYWNSANTLTYDSDGFYWNASNNSLGIGTTDPGDELDVIGSIRASLGIHVGADVDSTYISGSSTGAGSTTLYIGNESILTSGDIGASVQAWDVGLDDISGLTPTDGNIIVGDGTNWVAESGNTARTSLGLGTSQSPTFNGITLSGLTDGIVKSTSGVLSGGNTVNLASASEVTGILDETNGGTGINTYTTGDMLYASATNTLSKLGIGANGYILSSNGTQPQWSDPSTLLSANYFRQGGNSFGATAVLGTNDNRDLRLETNNITALTIDTIGQVGIGTTSPAYNLDVTGTGRYTGNLTSATINTGQGAYEIQDASTTDKGLASFNTNNFLTASGAVSIKTGGVGSTEIASSGVTANTYGSSTQIPVIAIDEDGRITSASNQSISYENPLTFNNGLTRNVNTVSLGGTLVQDTSINLYGASASRNLRIYNSNSGIEDLYIDGTTDRVGIGTTAPAYKLDVNGDIRAASGSDYYVGSIGLNDNASLSSGASLIGLYDDSMINVATNTNVQSAIKQLDTAINALGDIQAIGDVTSGSAFTSGGTQGTSLWFYDPDGRGQLTRANLTTDRTYTLPDASGTIAFGTGTTGYAAYWTNTNTLAAEQFLSVSRGGTGVGTLTSGGILLGNGTGAIQSTAQPTDGQILIGSTGGNPTLGNISGTANQITVSEGAGTIGLSLPQDIATTSNPTFATVNTGQGAYELYAMNQNVRSTDGVTFNDVLLTPKSSATGAEGRIYYDSDDDNLYLYDGSQWVDLTQQDTDSVLTEAQVEAYAYDDDNSLDTIGGEWQVDFGGQNGTFNLNGTGDLEIQDNGITYATFDDSGVFTLDSIRLDGSNVGLTADTDLLALASGALTVNGTLSTTSSITGPTNETINGIDINSGTVSDVVNLTINTGGDLTIGTKGLNDTGANNTSSGATLVGVFDEFTNSDATTVQGVLYDLDAEITATTHSPVSLVDNGYDYLSLNSGSQTLTLTAVDLATDVTGLLPNTNGGTGINTSTSTGVPTISSGTWSVLSALSPTLGGTGDNTSSTTGVPYINAGNWQYESQLGVARGGTGASSFNSNGILYGNSTGAIQATTQGTDTYVLYSNVGTPAWLAQSSLNAGQLDSLDSGDFLRSSASDSFTSGTITFNTGTELDIASGAVLDINGTWNIGGTAVTSSASELNKLDGATMSTTELNLLTGRTGTLVDSNNIGSYATTAVTAGNGLGGGGTNGNLTLNVNTGNGISITGDAVVINVATSGATNLTTSYSGLEADADGVSLLTGCNTDETLVWTGTAWECRDPTLFGSITAVGDVNSGVAFTESGTQGSSLWFYDASGGQRGQLTVPDISADRTYTLPNATGTLPVKSGTPSTGYVAYWAGTDAIGGEQYLNVTRGGTGVGSLTDGGIVLGSGTGALTVTAQPTNGQLLVGSTGGDPVLANLTGTLNQISVSNGAGSITLSTPQDIGTSSAVTFATLDTGQGANELFDMDQNVLTSSNVTFGSIISSNDLTVDTDTLYVDSVDSMVGIGTTNPTYKLDVNGGIRIASGGSNDLYIGNIGLNDNTSSSSGASLIGLYDDTMNYVSGNTTVQGAIKQLDSAIGSNAHDPVTLNTTSYDYLSLSDQEITLGAIDATTDITGTLGPANGGTGLNTSASTGVPTISSGTWSVLSALSPALGGTGDNTSATTGVPYITAGNWLYETTLSTTRGGTGKALTPTAGSIVYTDADSFELTGVGTSGYILQSFGSSAPQFVDPATVFFDTKVAIDGSATAGYLGAANNDGVLRTDASLSYTDGGDYVTLGHADTSTQASVNNSTTTVIQDITLDTYGHLTGLSSIDLTTVLDNYQSWTAQDGDTDTYTITASDVLQFAEGTAIDVNFTADDVLTITNTGVTSLTGTTNQVNVSGSTGAITLSLPQDIATTSAPTFATLNTGQGANELYAMNQNVRTSDSPSFTGLTVSGLASGAIYSNSGVLTSETNLAVTRGGTGVGTFTSGGIVLGNGTSALNVTAQPTDGQLLIGYTGGNPVLSTLTAGTGIQVSNGSGAITVTNNDRGSSQDIFKNIAVATQSNIEADANSDTLTFVAGTNVSLTTDALNDSLTINSTPYTASNGITLSSMNFKLGGTLTEATTLTTGGNNLIVDLTAGTESFLIRDNGSAFASFSNDGIFTVDNIRIDGSNIGLTSDVDLLALSNSALTVNGTLSVTSTISAATDETLNGIDINAGTISDVVNLNINTGGTMTIGTTALNETNSNDSGSELIGVYTGGFVNLTPIADDLQSVLEEIDVSAHPALSLTANGKNYVTLDGATQVLSLANVSLTSEVSGILPTANGGTGDNTGSTTGVPYIVAGDWNYETALSLSRGGTGKNLTASGGSVIYSDGDSFEMSSVGNSGEILMTAGAGAPSWANIASFLTAGNDIDLTGTTNVTISLPDSVGLSTVSASSAGGLSLRDDGGNLGVFIEDGGYVGVGINNPVASLHVGSSSGSLQIDGVNDLYVYNDIELDGELYINNTALYANIIGNRTYTEANYISNGQSFTGSLDSLDQQVYDVTVGNSGVWRDQGTYIYPNNYNLFSITDSGNVGIGTTSPSAKLVVAGTQGTITAPSGDLTFDASTNQIYFSGDDVYDINNIEIDGYATFASIGTPTAVEGRVYYDESNATLYVYNGGSWIDLGGQFVDNGNYVSLKDGEFIGNSASAGSSKVSGLYLSDSAPVTLGTDNDFSLNYNGTGLVLSDGTNTFLTVTDAGTTGTFNFNSNGFYIDSSGNSGFGTSSPNERVDIRGRMYIGDTSAPSTTTNRLYSVSGELFWNGVNLSKGSDHYYDVRTSNFTKSNTTLSNVGDLVFPVTTNDTWVFEIHVQLDSNTTADAAYNITAPTGSTCSISAQSAETGDSITNVGCGTRFTLQSTTTNAQIITGYVTTSTTSGNVQLQHAQNVASGTNTIYSGSYIHAYRLSGADLAEVYYTDDMSVLPGVIVSLDPSASGRVQKADITNYSNVLGVVSTKPGSVIGEAEELDISGKPVFVGLTGRVPVLVSDEDGEVVAGDFLNMSLIPGIAKKATRSGMMLGKALESFEDPDGDGLDYVMMYINVGWYDLDDTFASILQDDATFINRFGTVISDYLNGITPETGYNEGALDTGSQGELGLGLDNDVLTAVNGINLTGDITNSIISQSDLIIGVSDTSNDGDIILDPSQDGAVIISEGSDLKINSGSKFIFDSGYNDDSYFEYESLTESLGIFVNGNENIRLKSQLDESIDLRGEASYSDDVISQNYPSQNTNIEAGDVVSIVSSDDSTDGEYYVDKTRTDLSNSALGVVVDKSAILLGRNSFTTEICTEVNLSTEYKQIAIDKMIYESKIQLILQNNPELKGINVNAMIESLISGQKEDKVTQEQYDIVIDQIDEVILTDAELLSINDKINNCTASNNVSVAISGKVAVKVDNTNGEIKAGDLLGASSVNEGMASKAVDEGWVIGKALENQSSSTDIIMATVIMSWYPGQIDSTLTLSEDEQQTGLLLDDQNTDNLEINKNIIGYQNMNILGSTNLFDVNVTGDLSVGLISIDGVNNSINSVGDVLKLQNAYGSGNVDIFNGNIILTTTGDILADKGIVSAKEVKGNTFTVKVPVQVPNLDSYETQEEKDLAIESAQEVLGESSIGSAVLSAGSVSIVIPSTQVDENSKVFVTATSSTYGQTLIVSQKTDGEFTVSVDGPVTNDITFDYWIVKTQKQISLSE